MNIGKEGIIEEKEYRNRREGLNYKVRGVREEEERGKRRDDWI